MNTPKRPAVISGFRAVADELVRLAKENPNPPRGTPKTLQQAVQNGSTEEIEWNSSVTRTVLIEQHVADFIRQKLGVLMLSEDPAEVAAARKLQKLLGV